MLLSPGSPKDGVQGTFATDILQFGFRSKETGEFIPPYSLVTDELGEFGQDPIVEHLVHFHRRPRHRITQHGMDRTTDIHRDLTGETRCGPLRVLYHLEALGKTHLALVRTMYPFSNA